MNAPTGLTDIVNAGNVFFLLWGAVLIFSMHAGFAFLEAGSVRKKNIVNALTKIPTDWAVSTVVYFIVGFPISYGITFLGNASGLLANNNGYNLAHFFFLLCFAAVIPAIISGGVAERMKFGPQVLAGAIFVGFAYPFFEGLVWGRFNVLGSSTGWLASAFGAGFHDYAGSVVVHAMGGWLALPGILLLGPRMGRYVNGISRPLQIHSVPFVALGSWLLMVGWFGFNVASAATLPAISGLVAANSLLAMGGGLIAAVLVSKRDSVFVYNGALAGLVAVCAGSDVMHPLAALVTGAIAGIIFVKGFLWANEKLKIDDVLGVWPLHGLCGAWGGIAAGIFGYKALGGLGGVNFLSQLVGTVACIAVALASSFIVYGAIKKIYGIRLTPQEELLGSDLVVHAGKAYPEELI
ncbi:MAG: ammonium transporter [Actinomycetota bacterium]|nr:ammonium transporter [Actinomycetota bacterium]MCL6092557.1 ammonium transporter [Actinomycetota bacterium]MDA8167757.1 ammonium transporter [Actinomycetota bacterium]